MARFNSVATRIWVALILVLGLFMLVGGIAVFVEGFSTIDPSTRCSAGVAQPCMSRSTGVVERADERSISVSADDGIHSLQIRQRGDAYPEAGTQVLVERWNGQVVAIVDRTSERRYRTDDWPARWKNGPGFTGIGVGMLLLIYPGMKLYRRFRPSVATGEHASAVG